MQKRTKPKKPSNNLLTDPLFGVAGFPPNFFTSEYGKNRNNIFEWLRSLNLDVLELQCTYGIRMSDEQAIRYRGLAAENGITLTIHAPYYVNLGSKNTQTVENSKKEIVKAFRLANLVGSKRIIFHPGGGHGKTEVERAEGISRLISALNELKSELDAREINIYPEIGGKVSSLGNLDEIIRICKSVEYACPCIDLAHLHSREGGSLFGSREIVKVLDKIKDELGDEKLLKTHFHMYPVEFSQGGEKVHKAFGDKDGVGSEYGPNAADFIKAIKARNLRPLIICEAHNTQEIGAMLMRDIYNR